MLRDLETAFGGERGAAEVTGVSVITLRSWKHRQTVSIPSRRVIWHHWALLLNPDTIQTVFDFAAWGRFRVVRRRRVIGRSPRDGSDFQI
jgi:hypothetical protein